MSFYSFKVQAEDDVILPRYFLAIGEGFDVFNLVVDNYDQFVEELRANGVRVVESFRLDEHEEIPPVTIDLAGDASGHTQLFTASIQARDDR